MFNKFKKGEKVTVYGYGEEFGKLYYHETGIVKQRDPYYKDYLVRFRDGRQEWFLPNCLHKPYSKRKNRRK